MTTTATSAGTALRLTSKSGEIFAAPETATITPETGEMTRPVFETCIIGAMR